VIWHATPWLSGNIGGGLNLFVERLPEDAWVCLRDGDTLWLTSDWGALVERVVAEHGDQYSVIGCMTNRLRSPHQLHGGAFNQDPDIGHHREIALGRWVTHGTAIQPLPRGVLAGMCLIFPKRVWVEHPFEERSIHFDKTFCEAVRAGGGRLGIALGLYLFHLYRWGARNPSNAVAHLAGAAG